VTVASLIWQSIFIAVRLSSDSLPESRLPSRCPRCWVSVNFPDKDASKAHPCFPDLFPARACPCGPQKSSLCSGDGLILIFLTALLTLSPFSDWLALGKFFNIYISKHDHLLYPWDSQPGPQSLAWITWCFPCFQMNFANVPLVE
jgi:hypothetical protein